MTEHQIKESVAIVRTMIRSFFIYKNVDVVLSNLNKNSFSWIGNDEDQIFVGIDELEKCLREDRDIVSDSYKLIDEKYSVVASSNDSCVVVAKIFFEGLNQRQGFKFPLHFTFYLQLIDDELKVSHYHASNPLKKEVLNSSNFFVTNNQLVADFQFQHMLMNNFFDSDHTPMKSFCYERDFPYCFVNQSFLDLLEVDNSDLNKLSSLIHIHPDDQQRYINVIVNSLDDFVKNSAQSLTWNGSYKIIYHTQSLNGNFKLVFEWGNLFTFNSHTIVNALVLNLNEGFLFTPPLTTFNREKIS